MLKIACKLQPFRPQLGASIVEVALGSVIFIFITAGLIQFGLYAHYALKFKMEFKSTLLKIASNHFAACAHDPDHPQDPDADIWLDLLQAEFAGDCPLCQRLATEAQAGPKLLSASIRNWDNPYLAPSASVTPGKRMLMQSLAATAEWKTPSIWGSNISVKAVEEVVIQTDWEQIEELCP